MPKPYWYLLILFFCCPFFVSAQLTITGITRDSTTLAPLPFVSIQVAGKARALSDIDGHFSFSCHVGDTSVFTHMGFKKKVKIHFKNEISLTVLLGESAQMLKAFTFIDNFKPQGKDQWKDAIYLNKTFVNTVGTDPNAIQTFGVGARISGPISRFSKYEKDKVKYKKELDDMAATQTYREVMVSDEVKQDLMKLFALSEPEYYKKIEKFNIGHPRAQYIKDRKEIINMLVQFFAVKEK